MSFVKYTEILPIIHSMIIKLEDEDETLGDPYLEFSEKNNKEGRSETFLTDCTLSAFFKTLFLGRRGE